MRGVLENTIDQQAGMAVNGKDAGQLASSVLIGTHRLGLVCSIPLTFAAHYMASKLAASVAAPAHSAALPPALSPQSSLLTSVFPLPQETDIIYVIYEPASTSLSNRAHEFIEQAREQVILRNDSWTLLDSFLPLVQVDKSPPTLYLFCITSHDRMEECLERLRKLTFENLVGEQECFL
jgi:hypothetical protein